MDALPAAARPALRRLARRLAVGLFLDVWPSWAAASLLAAGTIVIGCRLFVPAAAPYLSWLLLLPLLAAVPAAVLTLRRRYRDAQVVAIADSLSGGQGLLLALSERPGSAWEATPMAERASAIGMPRVRPWKKLAMVPVALAFLVAALLLPQRTDARPDLLADQIAGDLTGTLLQLKEEGLITPEDEERLEEEIERIRASARERVDASTWEAADALRERLSSEAAAKQDAIAWAEESLARYTAAAAASGGAGKGSAAAADLMNALAALMRTGALAGAPEELQRLAAAALDGDAEALAGLGDGLGQFLGQFEGRGGGRALATIEGEPGRFDADEFPLDEEGVAVAGGNPGRGGITRGRADAELTRGPATEPHDRFTAQALPPGYVRGPDDFAPAVAIPGAPVVAPTRAAAAAARDFGADPGSAAWRRTLAPRHQSAVRKYFEK